MRPFLSSVCLFPVRTLIAGRVATVCSARPAHGLGALCLFAACLLFSACAKNTVNLLYNNPTENIIPKAGMPSVAVIPFSDLRKIPSVGRRSDGSDFIPSSNVNDWISHALAVELSRKGFVVTTASSEAEARASASYIVTGSVDELWLTEKSSTEYDVRMSGTLIVKNWQKKLLTRSFSSALARRVVPLSSVPQEMLSETATEMVKPMAHAVYELASP